MPIACISAAKMEIEWLLNRLRNTEKRTVSGKRLWVGEIGGHRLGIFCCGIGPEKASLGIKSLNSIFPADRVYHLGVCGSLDDSLEVETPVMARTVISSYAQKRSTAELNISGGEELNRGLPELSPRQGVLLSHHRPVLSGEERTSLRKRYGADCVDLETWEIASFCRDSGLPLTVIKTVSDTAGSSATVEFDRHGRRAAAVSCKLVYRLILSL